MHREERGHAVDAYDVDEVALRAAAHAEQYLEITRGRSASVGLYSLVAGGVDPQGPHDRDEVYHVLRGRARLRVGDDDRPVRPGSIVYVDAGVPHGFHAIEEDLRVLVFFAETDPAVLAARTDPGRAIAAAPGTDDGGPATGGPPPRARRTAADRRRPGDLSPGSPVGAFTDLSPFSNRAAHHPSRPLP